MNKVWNGQLLNWIRTSANDAARTSKPVENSFAPHSVLSESLKGNAYSLSLPMDRDRTMANQTEDAQRIRILLLDEFSLFRASLARFLVSQPDFEVTAECGTPAEALEVIKGSTVDVVLLDFDLVTEHDSDFIAYAKQAGCQARFLIIAGALDARMSAQALKQGASGILLKSENLERLVWAIKLVAKGEMWVDPKVIQFLADELMDRYHRAPHQEPSYKAMEDRERNVLLGILEGLTNRKIGVAIGLSESAVKNVVQRLFGKAGVKTRGQLVRLALEGSLGIALPKAPPRLLSKADVEIPS